MIREELEKEAEEKAKKRTKGFKCQDNCEKSYVMGALDFAEPREKQIKELTEQNTSLLTSVENLNKSVQELETQIEKMKCCSMCKYYSMSFLPYWCTKNNTAPHCTSKCDKWEIREK